MRQSGLIYIARHKESGKVYVGQTVDFKTRLRTHLRSPLHFGCALRKYGVKAFAFTQIPYPIDWLDFWEAYWISSLRSLHPFGYNFTEGGQGVRGYRHSEERREKISASRRGEKNFNFGKHKSEETKKKLALAHIGLHPSEETRRKMSVAHKGHKMTEDNRRKLIECNVNRVYSEEMRQHLSEVQKRAWALGHYPVRAPK
jgi:group I intron endonuclease